MCTSSKTVEITIHVGKKMFSICICRREARATELESLISFWRDERHNQHTSPDWKQQSNSIIIRGHAS